MNYPDYANWRAPADGVYSMWGFNVRLKAGDSFFEHLHKLVAAVKNSQSDPLGLALAIQEWE